jgi:hypothetical protein
VGRKRIATAAIVALGLGIVVGAAFGTPGAATGND